MSLKFASSMGEVHYRGTSNEQLLRYWEAQSGIDSASTSGGFLSNTAIIEGSAFLWTPFFTERDTWICGGVFWNSGLLAGGGTMEAGFKFYRGGVEQLDMVVVPAPAANGRPDGQQYGIEVRRGATVLAATAAIFYAQVATIFQMKVTIDPSVGAFEVRAATTENQTIPAFTTVLSGVSVNTADTGVAGADQIQLNYQVEANSARWDHFWVFDDQGSVNNDFPGKFLLVQGVVPNAQGAQNDWVSQGGQGGGSNDYESVNDDGGNINDDVGRHTSDTPGDVFLVGFQTPGQTGAPGFEAGPSIGSGANVQGLIFHHVSAMENSGNRTVRPIYRNAADTRAEGSDLVLSDITFDGYFEVFELNPISASAWTPQETIDMQWGLKLQS